ncbi:Superfamily II DNA or RNA helicase, SNF2 family [Halomonas shengliensis]|uniref:Superfamily II DNA or RNA helicase, SNF2 family n=1 Tax=Halomonas shengliensis TaxID=419597 RepID=A0A1H0NPA2_9GAMM|nr:DEAD/DEAH box helicase [Halomonas shengliensis]SDO94592.1 Superfamily II DNA or RNA helicase, SNF2 family [Halomonas shengliensis]
MPDAHLADPALTLYHSLEDVQWQLSFDARSLTRGRNYARQGRVRNGTRLEHEGKMLVLRAQVHGSGRSRYLTSLAVDPDNPAMGVVSDCSCPVGRQCKHAVAVIQHFIDELEADGIPPRNDTALLEQRWASWLAELQSPLSGKRYVEELESDYRLALFLDIGSDSRAPVLAVSPVWVRPAKQRARGNGWVKPRSIIVRRGGGLTPMPPQGLAPDQEEALELLMLGEQRRQYAGANELIWSSVTHAYQARALWSLLESDTSPLLFHPKQTGAMLDLGPACRLTLAWEADADGNQRLFADAEPADVISYEAVIMRAGHELCYLDTKHRRVGRLAGDPDLLLRLRHAPPLPPEMSGWLTEQLHEAPGLANCLPAPQAVEERTLEDVAPRLMVTMRIATGQLGDHHGVMVPHGIEVGAAVVDFDYDGIEVPPEEGDSHQAFRDGQRLTIQRNREAELALVRTLPPGMVSLERLKEIDAVPAQLDIPDWTLLLPLEGVPPRNAAEWPTHLADPDGWWEMIARLREAGCLVHFSDDFPEEPTYLEPDDWVGELEPAGNGWFDLALDIEVEGERLNLLPILRRLFKDPDFPLEPVEDEAEDANWTLALPENRRLVMPLARLRSLMTPILDWLSDESDPEAALRLPVTAAEKVAPLAEHERWAGRENVTALASRLRELPASLPAPRGFTGELRDYQARGIAWMRFLSELGTGGILADDMGLGKTVQVLAHILDERARGALTRPTLVVAPTTLVGNWCAEAERFAPELKVVALQGGKAQRERQFEEALPGADLAVTTYALLIRDLERLRERDFGLLVLDEAQAIKNAASQTARAVRALDAKRAIAMTGTPLENHLGELWAQLDAVAPGALGSQQWFGQRFRTPIEKDGDVELRRRLSRRIAPLMLRRTKQQVLAELPEKTDTRREVTLSGAQRELYESLRLAQHQRVQQAVAERGLAGSGIVMLDALLKLRQVCCDPRLVKLESARKTQRSAKLDQLRELVPPLVEEGRRILIFSQFTEMLALIGETLEKDGIPFTTLTGDTPGKTRTQRVALFQQGEIPVFLISLKAGGTGLNLTAADTVIHYDPWWNPAVEAQATGRAHRMGQQNPVFVYKLVCAGTVEERILDLQARKADLAASILEGGAERGGDGPLFDEEDLALLFAPVV